LKKRIKGSGRGKRRVDSEKKVKSEKILCKKGVKGE